MATLNSSALFAQANGFLPCGEEVCYYCGGQCGKQYFHEVYDTFLHLLPNSANAPAKANSKYCCKGCVLTLQTRTTVKLPGERREDGQDVSKYSWVVTEKLATAFRKPQHLDELREACLKPPEPPFCILLTDGKSHHLYRCPVNSPGQDVANGIFKVRLNEEVVEYTAHKLKDRLKTVGRITAAVYGTETAQQAYGSVCRRYRDGAKMYDAWSKLRNEGLSRLAAWLSPDGKQCVDLYPGDDQKAEPGAEEEKK